MDVHAYEAAELKLPTPNLQLILKRLEAHGFHCTVITNPDNNRIKREVEGFATRTPVRGTALVYFVGQTAPGEYLKQKTLCLLDVKSRPGRGLGINYVLDQLQAKGGSSRNLVILDTPNDASPFLEIPDLHYGESVLKALGKPSKAVSPPYKMIPGRKAGDEWMGPRGMVYCWCPPGKFTMGSPETETGRFTDEAQREVSVKEGFWISKYEWPRGLWRGNKNSKAIDHDKLHPVNMVSQSKDTLSREIKPMNESAKKANPSPRAGNSGFPPKSSGNTPPERERPRLTSLERTQRKSTIMQTLQIRRGLIQVRFIQTTPTAVSQMAMLSLLQWAHSSPILGVCMT